MERKNIELKDSWNFVVDPLGIGLSKEYHNKRITKCEKVYIPHTYNVKKGLEEYRGKAWYQYIFKCEEEWAGKRFILRFQGVYRDMILWVNGKEAVKHFDSGFTSFEIDISNFVKSGENLFSIQVDNSYSTNALPYGNKFDWADDGGIFRPVHVIISDPCAFEYVHVNAIPDIENGTGGNISINYGLSEKGLIDYRISYELLFSGDKIACGDYNGEEIYIEHTKWWDFDSPNLYTLRLFLINKTGVITDTYVTRIGFRKFECIEDSFWLNGKKVRLVGAEWMPGSDPRIGNAEKKKDIERYLQLLKDCNCVYTRVHWQQGDDFFDWCDEHGMLVQEEIPLWGEPAEPKDDTVAIVRQQAEEMIMQHFNHPSIVSWGIGNELNGNSEITRRYVKDAMAILKSLDNTRACSYVSNTAFNDANDACTFSDIQMCNEYIGTWNKLPDAEEAVAGFLRASNQKPTVISEFGLCEPAFQGGDKRRQELFKEKLEIYRNHHIAGIIWFCLNDYRTQMGEEGTGKYRKRVHGSVDLYGNPKPSYETIASEFSPLMVQKVNYRGDLIKEIVLKVKDTLPSYGIDGYSINIQKTLISLPKANPGDEVKVDLMMAGIEKSDSLKCQVYRPNGEFGGWLNI